jgi:serine/threonine-protein kinase HipA
MESKQVNILHVKYNRNNTLLPMGRLAIKNRKIFFEYDVNFIATGLELSPFKLPLKPGVIACEDQIFEGLFGIFNDSLPDGWGRLLLDRKLMQLGLYSGSMTPLERLRYVGARGMGALQYEPEILGDLSSQHLIDLDLIADECLQLQESEESEFIDDLLVMNGSSAGARPKILVRLLDKKNKLEITHKNNETSQQGTDWIMKFRSSFDPKDNGSIEYAYHLMAKASGLNVPQAKLFKSKKCAGYFGVKRFDRDKEKLIHMHTVSGLIHADHRFPSLDYESIMKVAMALTKNMQECESQFRNVVFNVFAHNRDDHSKKFSFLMDENDGWRVSPAYDLTFSFGPGGEHCTTIMREGRNPTRQHLEALAKISGIEPKKAIDIINQVKDAVGNWAHFAKEAQVGRESTQHIQKYIKLT